MNSKQLIKIWSRVAEDACAGKSLADQKKIFARLEAILKAKKKSYLLARIIDNAHKSLAKRDKLEIVLAHEQTDLTVVKLKKILSAKMESGQNAVVKIDPALIGGFVARTSQYILNASIKSQLEQLKKIYEI